jgi:hypothetical protein
MTHDSGNKDTKPEAMVVVGPFTNKQVDEYSFGGVTLESKDDHDHESGSAHGDLPKEVARVIGKHSSKGSSTWTVSPVKVSISTEVTNSHVVFPPKSGCGCGGGGGCGCGGKSSPKPPASVFDLIAQALPVVLQMFGFGASSSPAPEHPPEPSEPEAADAPADADPPPAAA